MQPSCWNLVSATVGRSSIMKMNLGKSLSAARLIIATIPLLLLVGCSSDAVKTGSIHGEVALDGNPLKEGQIRFFSLDGGIGADGLVTDGKYNIVAKEGISAGKYRVEFSFEKKTGKKVPDRDGGPDDMKDEVIETLPAKFNRSSTIQIDYDPAKNQPLDFKL